MRIAKPATVGRLCEGTKNTTSAWPTICRSVPVHPPKRAHRPNGGAAATATEFAQPNEGQLHASDPKVAIEVPASSGGSSPEQTSAIAAPR